MIRQADLRGAQVAVPDRNPSVRQVRAAPVNTIRAFSIGVVQGVGLVAAGGNVPGMVVHPVQHQDFVASEGDLLQAGIKDGVAIAAVAFPGGVAHHRDLAAYRVVDPLYRRPAQGVRQAAIDQQFAPRSRIDDVFASLSPGGQRCTQDQQANSIHNG